MKKGLLVAFCLAVSPLLGFARAGDLRAFVPGSWRDIRQAHQGRPTVVHFWGLTCGPCRVEMPQWGALLAERRDFDFVTVDADLVPNEQASATAMLVRSGLQAAENWIFVDDFVERLRYEIDPQWQGEIPMTLLISRDGAVTTLEGSADLARVRDWLDAETRSQR
jgi:thiol-disulfide isomerase/thioredoxin